MKTKLIIFGAIVIALGAAWMLWPKTESAQAEKLTILNGDLHTVSAALGNKQITNNADLKLLFDYDAKYALVGRGWEGETVQNSESIGGTNLYLINVLDGSEQKISDSLIRWAIYDQKNNLIYFTDLAQDLWRFDIAKKQSEKIMDKVLTPDLSPDGKYLVYQKLNPNWEQNGYYDEALGLTILDINTGQEKRITDKWEDWAPIWSPDGKKIMFFGASPEGLASHFSIDIDGQNRIQLTNNGITFVHEGAIPVISEKPVWSPDGTTWAYESDRAIWLNKFNDDKTEIIEAKFVTYGKEPTWINNGQGLNVVLNDQSTAQVQSVNVDLTGKIIK